MKVETFEAAHVAVPAPLGAWRHDCAKAEWLAFADAAHEAGDWENGLSILPEGKDVAVTFRGDLFVRYIGGAEGPQGCWYYGFLFTVPEMLEVMAWIEDDGIHARVLWRGDQATFERAALEMKLRAGAWLPALQRTS